MIVLLAELLKCGELPPLGVGGVAAAIRGLIHAHVNIETGRVVLESNVCEIIMAQLRSIGTPADWVVSVLLVVLLCLHQGVFTVMLVIVCRRYFRTELLSTRFASRYSWCADQCRAEHVQVFQRSIRAP